MAKFYMLLFTSSVYWLYMVNARDYDADETGQYQSANGDGRKRPLNFSPIAAFPHNSVPLRLKYLFYMETKTVHGDGTYPLRDILVDLVNRNSSILPAYNVSIDIFDTMFNIDYNVGRTIELFSKHIASDNNASQCVGSSVLHVSPTSAPLFFGPEYSSEAKVIAQVAPFYNLVQIASVANAPNLSDRKRYPNFFRTCMSSNQYVNIPRALLTYFNYTRVALVTFDDTYAREPMQKIDYDLHNYDYDVLFNARILPNDNNTLDRLMRSIKLFDARIIILWSGDLEDYRIFCQAMQSSVIEPGKHLIISLGLDDAAAVLEPQFMGDDLPRCTREKLAKILNGTLIALSPPWAPNGKLDLGLTTKELIAQAEKIGRNRYGHATGRLHRYVPLMIDAFWLGFLALDAVDRRLRRQMPSPRSLVDFTFASKDIATMLGEEVRKVHFRGANGYIAFSANGERRGQISIQQYRPGTINGPFFDVFHVSTDTGRLEFISAPIFNTPNGQQPLDHEPPAASTSGSNSMLYIIIVVCSVGLACILIVCATSLYIYRRAAQARQLEHPAWLVDQSLLVMRNSGLSTLSVGRQSMLSVDRASRPYSVSTSTQTALLNEQVVRIQVLPVIATILVINLQTHKVFSALRENLLHVNVVRFIGYCIESAPKTTQTNSALDEREQYLLWEHCEKGSLEQLVENDTLKLDAAFEYAIMQDIAQGMAFLHKSFVCVHGALRASACCIDRRFSIKIADYGDKLLAPMFELLSIAEESTELIVQRFAGDGVNEDDDSSEFTTSLNGERRLYWSPDLLRSLTPTPTPPDDVYAYAITVHVLLTRSAPFESSGLPPHKLLEAVRQMNRPPAPFRPEMTSSTELQRCDKRLLQLVQQCWAEDPTERPTFADIVRQVRTISGLKSSSSSVTDQLLRRLERYASDMESLVQERTRELDFEKRRSDELLNAMLPPQIAEELKRSGRVSPESFDSVTIYFSDIVGFTTLSSNSTPLEVVNLLNALYSLFDAKIDLFDAYKVETIGDAYMVVSGLPQRNETKHVVEIGRLALTLLNAIRTFVIPHRPTESLALRVGLHTGPCVAGVVGIKMPRYCLFGDTVNTTSRMESTGKPLRIHISEPMKQAFDAAGVEGFVTKLRGTLEVKGKGSMQTYWLFPDDGTSETAEDLNASQIDLLRH